MAKYKSGDPVWVRNEAGSTVCLLHKIPPGEYAGVVLCFLGEDAYEVTTEVLKYPANAREYVLRPRRDDYQQHEGLGSMNKILLPLADQIEGGKWFPLQKELTK